MLGLPPAQRKTLSTWKHLLGEGKLSCLLFLSSLFWGKHSFCFLELLLRMAEDRGESLLPHPWDLHSGTMLLSYAMFINCRSQHRPPAPRPFDRLKFIIHSLCMEKNGMICFPGFYNLSFMNCRGKVFVFSPVNYKAVRNTYRCILKPG